MNLRAGKEGETSDTMLEVLLDNVLLCDGIIRHNTCWVCYALSK